MKKIILNLLITSITLFAVESAPELDEKFKDSKKCMPCHLKIQQEWSKSYHSKSHFNSNEYLAKSMKYISRKIRKSEESVKIQCAACHNPRISVTETGLDYEIDRVMKLNTQKNVGEAINDDSLNEGVNCLVCHNVNKVHTEYDSTKRGIHRIEWNEVGVMSGPFDDAVSPYHKTQYRDFIGKDPKELCFVCHANDSTIDKKHTFANTQKEYKETQKQCADCHMSPKKPGVASNLPIDNGKPKSRMVREHIFAGAHVDWMWEEALQVSAKKVGEKIDITLNNNNPHNIPTGFGGREILIEVEFKNGSEVIKTKNISLTQNYIDKYGKPTVPHLAVKMSDNNSVPANGSKTITIDNVKGSGSIVINVYYKLVNDEIQELLELKEKEWTEKKYITKTILRY